MLHTVIIFLVTVPPTSTEQLVTLSYYKFYGQNRSGVCNMTNFICNNCFIKSTLDIKKTLLLIQYLKSHQHVMMAHLAMACKFITFYDVCFLKDLQFSLWNQQHTRWRISYSMILVFRESLFQKKTGRLMTIRKTQ